MALYKIKFFGAKQYKHEQVRQVKLVVEAKSAADVENVLRRAPYGYAVIQGLKIHEYNGE